MNDRITYDEALELIEKHWGWPCAAQPAVRSVNATPSLLKGPWREEIRL